MLACGYYIKQKHMPIRIHSLEVHMQNSERYTYSCACGKGRLCKAMVVSGA